MGVSLDGIESDPDRAFRAIWREASERTRPGLTPAQSSNTMRAGRGRPRTLSSRHPWRENTIADNALGGPSGCEPGRDGVLERVISTGWR
ncbi:MAG: hypothetical protein CL933_01225 [Deltaproteobacteria bacterium]|nr:hypothetical protein [Deltaproteobacteria bacterium]